MLISSLHFLTAKPAFFWCVTFWWVLYNICLQLRWTWACRSSSNKKSPQT